MTKAATPSSRIAPANRQAPQPFIDVNALPETYAMRCVGGCMEPEILDGALLVFDRLAPVRSGDLVVIISRPELVPPGGLQAIVKRLVFGAPRGLTFPFDPHPESEVSPLVVVQQLNPPRTMQIRCERIAAMHRCVGTAEAAATGKAMLDPATIESARAGQ